MLLLDWGEPDDEDADLGLDFYVCDAIPAAIRETRRATGAEEVVAARLVHRRDAVRDVRGARSRTARCAT